jgi:uncharacterized protein YbbK (DUF523 family)
MKLCSACLLGVKCRYDGRSRPHEKVLALAEEDVIIPVCPEQLGGLPTPRLPAEQRNGKVFDKSGNDVTAQYAAGAEEVLRLARLYGAKEAILKQRSPSCGCGQVYDGTFSGKIVRGDGVTAALLKKHGVRVVTEEEL